MTSRMTIIPKYLDELKLRFDCPLTIIETGTIRNTAPQYHDGDGHSTLYIAAWVKLNGGNFYSIDLYTGTCEEYLSMVGLDSHVKFRQQDSITAINDIKAPIHFALLDSANVAQLTLDEFKAIESKLIPGSTVIIDDVIMDSKDVVKGHKVVPYIKEKGYPYVIQDRLCIIRII